MCEEKYGFVGMVEVHGFDIAKDEALENIINITSSTSEDDIDVNSFLI
jgi:hypothetical protein